MESLLTKATLLRLFTSPPQTIKPSLVFRKALISLAKIAKERKLDTVLYHVPNTINVIEIASLDYSIKSSIPFNNMGNIDFSVSQIIGYVNIDGFDCEITVKVENNFFTITCSNTIDLEVFYGRDRYL